MKNLLIPVLALLPFGTLFAAESKPQLQAFQHSEVIDTAKKTFSEKEWKELEKKIKTSVPKDIAKVMIKQLKNIDPDKLTNLDPKSLQQSVFKFDMMSDEMEAATDKADYETERKEIIEDFKNDSFDDASEKREARREMKEDLRELKRDFQEEQKEKRQERRENKKEAGRI
ncbi:hypothetical protein [Pedobacter frigoris]|uniref:DUF3106 domain-containing protein n=1 Tax=Pedobacter frigoris TaxID=2571272 RepID=A0A4U1CKU2_9SPHI|nr:hypothetical protein [Pedobacter frigoris]TKC07639.1 hypothetical protein FA047_10410 [Pedobacter frigoris]